MFKLLPPQDMANPDEFLTAVTVLFAEYAPEIGAKAAFEIPQRTDRATMKVIRELLDEFNQSAIEKQRVRELRTKPKMLPRPPRTEAEQQAIDRHVAECRKALGIPETGVERPTVNLPISSESEGFVQRGHDGDHIRRVMADLERRRARNSVESEISKAG